MVMLLREMWVPGAASPWFQRSPMRIQSERVTGASEGMILNCQCPSEPMCFAVPVSALFQKLLLGQTVCMAMKRKNSCIPNTFQVCAKITREQNSSHKYFLEFLYRQVIYFFPAIGLGKSSTCKLFFY